MGPAGRAGWVSVELVDLKQGYIEGKFPKGESRGRVSGWARTGKNVFKINNLRSFNRSVSVRGCPEHILYAVLFLTHNIASSVLRLESGFPSV